MTSLGRAVRRKTRFAYTVLYRGEARPIIVSLEPGDVISFREAGRRQRWRVAIDHLFRQAVRDAALAARREKRAGK
jgi:Leu/Phe-tRNA-protein transferase